MHRQKLNEDWIIQNPNTKLTLRGKVPFSVLQVYKEAGLIPDPYKGDNEDKVLDLMREDFVFEKNFEVEEKICCADEILLIFEGIDTFAHIYLNDVFLADIDNMHRTYRFEVKNILKPHDNTLRILVDSPINKADDMWEIHGTCGQDDCWQGFSNLRKAHYSYGWDWGAHLPDMGIFRDVSLCGIEFAYIDNFYVSQKHKNGVVELEISTENKEYKNANKLKQKLTITQNGEIITSAVCDLDEKLFARIDNPKLWWPNNLGDQPLYEITVELILNSDRVVDSRTEKIGLRTLTINRTKDETGESFAQEVNGQTFFAMGADYIPEEHIIPLKTKEKTRRLLEDCVRANFNTIRVWGGGYYPDDYFYELCDELGLVVWQDFMFACSAYKLTSDFEENIKEEIKDNLLRLRNHPSLGILCGNNEMEDFVNQRVWISNDREVEDYLTINESIIPALVKEYAPDIFYWPSSPSSGGGFDNPQDPDRGDCHFWQVWHSGKPFTEYRKYKFRYLSEFGFQSLPQLATIKEGITEEENELNLFSYTMEKHQRNQAANGKIMNYLQKTYRYPWNFSDLIYASQLLAADGIRYGVEHFRRYRGQCMGAVYWQLNDCWPVISWSSIDYYGRWKALHYYAKRFFEPIHISCEEQGWVNAKQPDFNRQHFDKMEKSIRLNVTNETPDSFAGKVKWSRRSADGKVLESWSENVEIKAFSTYWLDKQDMSKVDLKREYIYFELLDEEEKSVSSGTVILGLPKYFEYENPHISCEVQGDELVVKATSYAAAVEILNDSDDLVLSDNYFDMNPGVKRLKIISGKPDNIRVRSVRDIGRG